MTPKETQLVAEHLRAVYSLWHQCALRELTVDEEAQGLRVGQLCDNCEGEIEARLSDIHTESVEHQCGPCY